MTSDRPSLAYIWLMIASGAVVLGHGFWTWHTAEPGKYLSYLLVALIASGIKIRLPSVHGTMSVSFLFVLIGVSEFSLGETLLLGGGGALVQSVLYAKKTPKPVQVLFNLASVACAIQGSWWVQHGPLFHSGLLTAATYFLINTLSVAAVIALTTHKNVWTLWREAYFWSFPNYLVGAAVVWLVGQMDRLFGWQAALFLFPVLYFLNRSHRMYVERLEEAKKRAEQEAAHALEVAAMHRRTIETLALAVEAKDQNTHDHLERVETYAVEVGKELGLDETQIAELRAAALLHDIGKLAVPEYIIAKPGKLTREEFAQMKTHTVVGAEIVERMRFPYQVAPIVRGHHEKWDGSGYPDGLAGTEIPMGARIMAAVDCLDALCSDRQYRRAMPLSDAIEVMRAEAGKSFDPEIVDVLVRRYMDFDALVKKGNGIEKLPVGIQVARGDAPAAGFENTDAEGTAKNLSALSKVVNERPALTMLTSSLQALVSWDALAVYLRSGDTLTAKFVDGEEFRPFLSCEGKAGKGVSGWAAENGKAIVNGNPSVEPGHAAHPAQSSALRSALALPLITPGGILGVVSLYRRDSDAFTAADLETLTSWAPAFVSIVQNGAARVEPVLR